MVEYGILVVWPQQCVLKLVLSFVVWHQPCVLKRGCVMDARC